MKPMTLSEAAPYFQAEAQEILNRLVEACKESRTKDAWHTATELEYCARTLKNTITFTEDNPEATAKLKPLYEGEAQ
jgi:hypothetical protein